MSLVDKINLTYQSVFEEEQSLRMKVMPIRTIKKTLDIILDTTNMTRSEYEASWMFLLGSLK